MNLGLETDVSNPNFAGARNPDDALWVQFSVRPMQNNYETAQQNRPIFRDETWVEIRIPGRNDLTIERPMCEEDKFRFPRQWSYFERTHSADGQNVGTPLSAWPLLKPSQIEQLKALRFMTVEQIAMASDENLSRIGMNAGMSAHSLRDRAKLYLDHARDNSVAVKQMEELKAREKEIADLKAAQEASSQKHAQEMAELRELIKAATAPRKAGRPRKNSLPETQPEG